MNNEIVEKFKELENLFKTINGVDKLEFLEWMKQKADIKYNKKLPSFPIYNNFIYWCNLGINIGSEQNKLRPVIILKSANKSPICSIIPLTSKRLNDEIWFHIDLKEIDSTALIEQLRVISKLRIISPYRKKGNLVTISKEDWDKINFQLESLYRLRKLKDE